MKKLKSSASTIQQLVHECEKETQLRCSSFQWRDLNNVRYDPVQRTVALLVDMRHAAGCAVYIHNESDEFVDMVGMESAGHVVIVPWVQGMKIVCYGKCIVAETTLLEDSSS
ncbi:hypothetical protein CKAH01_11538 [Colletotrichum kahawae]|uniref:Uncharacterized protein n=1 Tax=Colletotrichum kahawae TaxID=34407 RepID=A0AAD9YUF6_COLKA|nr:hypothetical protein CKAH01_11538 [Colletotrichum kahawae]